MPKGVYQRSQRALADRFAEKWEINHKTGCWEWTAHRNRAGYGSISIGGRTEGRWLAHRVSWLLHKGEDPAVMEVCHGCDNPRCVNPEHLFLGTHQKNMRDSIQKGRHIDPPNMRGEDHPNAKLTNKDVEFIRSSGKSSRRLASELGVSKTAVIYVRQDKMWRHV